MAPGQSKLGVWDQPTNSLEKIPYPRAEMNLILRPQAKIVAPWPLVTNIVATVWGPRHHPSSSNLLSGDSSALQSLGEG